MRELYKGKRITNEDWAEGNLLISDNRYFIVPDFGVSCIEERKYGDAEKFISLWAFEINPKTVCKDTNLTDSSRKAIWENDIVEVIWCSGKIERYLIWWSREMSMMEAISLKDINFNGHDYWGGQPQIEYSTFCLIMQDPWGDIKEVKVVGNIFDNPELLNDN